MDSINTVCPVCTLFLRPGITLKDHLSSHPKYKVIEALVKLASVPDCLKESNTSDETSDSPSTSQVNTAIVNNQVWNQPLPGHFGSNAAIHPVHGNHVFIYQQSMSTTTPQGNVLNVNPLSQQYVYPTVFNPQMMPYVYQQQQVIMSSNSMPPHLRALPPFELPSTSPAVSSIASSIEECASKVLDNNADNNERGENMDDEISNEPDVVEEVCEVSVAKHEARLESKNPLEVDTMEEFEHQQQERYDEIPPEHYSSDPEDMYHNSCVRSPQSHVWNLHSELNKACQTHNNSPKSQVQDDEDRLVDNEYADGRVVGQEYFFNHQNHEYQSENGCFPQEDGEQYTSTKMNVDTVEQTDPIYTSANILHGNENMDFVNMDDVVIIGDFSTTQVISRVEDFENTLPDRSRAIMMTIGDLEENIKSDYNDHRDPEGSMSRGSSHLNIRSDERMPARGELSGQESMGGASDITWNRMQYQEGSSHMSNSYNMIGRDSWDGSDSDSVDSPSIPRRNSNSESHYQNDLDNEQDTPTIVSYSGPPLNFRCPTCGEDFATSKERKEHELARHPERKKGNLIGSDISKKKVKKLIVKKILISGTEPNFDNVFTNKLKQESTLEIQQDDLKQNRDIDIDQSETKANVDLNKIMKNSVKAVCSICDCVLENAKDLKQHKLEAHQDISKVKNKCSTCNEVFANEYSYREHLKIHPLECRLCGKLFYRKQNIQLHMKRHFGLKPYKCDICQKCFVTRQKHDEHKNIHTGETPIKCTLCNEKFRRHSNLVQHRNRHHYQMKKKLKDYICQCGEIFHSKKKLAWHKEIHEGKPKACTECTEKFLHMSSLTRHMRRAHNKKFLPEETRINENVECPICKRTFLKSSLDYHIKTHSGERPYQCLICNKDFTTKWNLKLHKWTHASRTSKPFKCDQCKGAFIRESDYIAHMNSHKSVRPYTCNYCGAQFIRKYNCLRHVKEHESNKRFTCNVCGKSFHRSYYLKDHMRVHSGVRPYTCHICGKTSTTKSNHNKHVQIHHAREPVSTEN